MEEGPNKSKKPFVSERHDTGPALKAGDPLQEFIDSEHSFQERLKVISSIKMANLARELQKNAKTKKQKTAGNDLVQFIECCRKLKKAHKKFFDAYKDESPKFSEETNALFEPILQLLEKAIILQHKLDEAETIANLKGIEEIAGKRIDSEIRQFENEYALIEPEYTPQKRLGMFTSMPFQQLSRYAMKAEDILKRGDSTQYEKTQLTDFKNRAQQVLLETNKQNLAKKKLPPVTASPASSAEIAFDLTIETRKRLKELRQDKPPVPPKEGRRDLSESTTFTSKLSHSQYEKEGAPLSPKEPLKQAGSSPLSMTQQFTAIKRKPSKPEKEGPEKTDKPKSPKSPKSPRTT